MVKAKKETKTSKKKAAKKTTTNKTKAATKKKKTILTEAPEEHYFVLVNGQPIKSLLELADTLEEIREEVFKHHVNQEKNDFANWTQDIFNEKELAEELREIMDKNHARIKIYRHIIKRIQ